MGKISFFRPQPQPKSELSELKEELTECRLELHRAYERFNQAVDSELLEACIYQINALQHRCNYLIRRIKEQEGKNVAAGSLGGDTVWT